jgi:hypothetical protein
VLPAVRRLNDARGGERMPSLTGSVVGAALVVAVAIAVFLFLRTFWCWYWKISRAIALLESIDESLKQLPAVRRYDHQGQRAAKA